jgi:signal transduction histidine kinase
LAELDETVALHDKAGLDPAMSATRADIGKRTTRDILMSVAALRKEETAKLTSAIARWQLDLRLSRWITLGGAILNIGLIALATALVFVDMRRRARQATALRDQKQELARQVEERTRELTALSTHLQGVSELEKSALSRELHDELGGLLVAARMDLSWLQHRLPTSDPSIEQRFKRIHESLSAGVDLKRRVVEELRPTLLDNMGLFAAVRWQFKESCRRTGLRCTESIPEAELRFTPDAAIGVFRVAQEALTNILKHAEAKSADLAIDIQQDIFVMRISDDGKGMFPARRPTFPSHGLASMRHRIAALGGIWELSAPPSGGTTVTARIPLPGMLLPEPVLALASRSL